MASLGGETFATLRARQVVAPAGNVTQEVTRAGTDGRAFLVLGKRAPRGEYETLANFPTANSRLSAKRDYKDFQGTVQTLVRDDGTTTSVFVHEVRITRETVAGLVVGPMGSGPYMLGATWVLEER